MITLHCYYNLAVAKNPKMIAITATPLIEIHIFIVSKTWTAVLSVKRGSQQYSIGKTYLSIVTVINISYIVRSVFRDHHQNTGQSKLNENFLKKKHSNFGKMLLKLWNYCCQITSYPQKPIHHFNSYFYLTFWWIYQMFLFFKTTYKAQTIYKSRIAYY